jgi:hypothetical protein
MQGGHSSLITYVGWFGPLILAAVSIAWLNRRYVRGLGGNRPKADLPVKGVFDAS